MSGAPGSGYLLGGMRRLGSAVIFLARRVRMAN